MIGGDSRVWCACAQIDEPNRKKRESFTCNVRVRLVAQLAIKGKREGCALLFARARACGALPYLSETSSVSPGRFSIEGFGVSFVFFGTGTRRLVRPVRG